MIAHMKAGNLSPLSMCLGLAGIGALVFTKHVPRQIGHAVVSALSLLKMIF